MFGFIFDNLVQVRLRHAKASRSPAVNKILRRRVKESQGAEHLVLVLTEPLVPWCQVSGRKPSVPQLLLLRHLPHRGM